MKGLSAIFGNTYTLFHLETKRMDNLLEWSLDAGQSRSAADYNCVLQNVNHARGNRITNYLEQLQLWCWQCVLAKRVIQSLRQAAQVPNHAPKSSKGKGAATGTGVTNLHGQDFRA